MNLGNFYFENVGILLVLIIPLVVWDLAWKAKGMWQAAKNHQKYWFVALLLVNSAGILPIIYLKFFQIKKNLK